jgi:D-alanyl-D-alanine carboxypeptidase/D-alanyl-D-alanine-endopeptidase (penicillin-binding protein 4)
LTRRSRREKGKPGNELALTDKATKRGIAGIIAKHPTLWLASALGVAFLILGVGSVFAGAAVGSGWAAPAPSATGVPLRTQPADIPLTSRLRTCSVGSILADPRLADFSGYVVNAATGETLLDRNGTTPQRTGSVLKTLTAAAALTILGPTAQLSTRVLDGSSPGTIVLVGGGDPTLATTTSTFYSGAPQIADLANAAMAQYDLRHPGVPVTSIVLDSTMWDPADNWDSSWLRKEQTNGYQAEVTALMVNGGRSNPAQSVSRRTSDPIAEAGDAFAAAAGLTGVPFSSGSAVGSTVLAEVKSQPLTTLISQMLISSDNVLAETLARVVSKSMGFNGSSASLAQAIPGALVEYGLTTTELTIRDGSGLSDLNAVSPQFVTQLMIKIRANEKNLGTIYSSLPVSGKTGTLATRFNGANEIATGAIIAKTGWLDTEYSLAGVVNAADGTPLAFAFYSIRDKIPAAAKEAQDTLATALFTCGDNLSNN